MNKLVMRDIKKGLRVVVTAGAAGIGRAIAENFADRGAKVFICDIDRSALSAIKNERPDIGQVQADVSDQKQVDILFNSVFDALGGLDVLVNNAGIAGPTAPIEEITIEEWRRTIDINLNGQFYCLRRAIPYLKDTENG